MARYHLKPLEVDAEPYRLGLEDEFSNHSVPVLVTPASSLPWVIGS